MQPLVDAELRAEPFTILVWFVSREVGQRCNDENTALLSRRAAEEVMFGQRPDEPVAAEQQGEGFDDRRLPDVVGAHENGVAPETQIPALHPTESPDRQARNPHKKLLLLTRNQCTRVRSAEAVGNSGDPVVRSIWGSFDADRPPAPHRRWPAAPTGRPGRPCRAGWPLGGAPTASDCTGCTCGAATW